MSRSCVTSSCHDAASVAPAHATARLLWADVRLILGLLGVVTCLQTAAIQKVVADVILDMQASGEPVPVALAEKNYSGEFRVRIPPLVQRNLARMAAEQGVSLNRLASAKLAA